MRAAGLDQLPGTMVSLCEASCKHKTRQTRKHKVGGPAWHAVIQTPKALGACHVHAVT
jgi:hypothetical protein